MKNYGVILCVHRWDNITWWPLVNVMMSCPSGDVFLGSVDTTGENITISYIADKMKSFIEKVGPQYMT